MAPWSTHRRAEAPGHGRRAHVRQAFRALVALWATTALAGCGRPKPEGRTLRAEELNTQGVMAMRGGHLLLAEESFLEALSAAEAVDDRAGRAAALLNLGRLELELGDLTRAADRFEGARDLARRLENNELLAVAASSMARVRSMEGRHDDAMKLARVGVARSRDMDSGDRKRRLSVRAAALVTLAWVARRAGDAGCNVARDALDEAETLYGRARSDAGRAAVAYNRALVLLARRDVAGAEKLLHTALAIDRERDAALDVGDDLRALSRAAALRGDPRGAVDALERALRVHVAVNATHRALADLEALSKLHRSGGNEKTATYLEGRADEIRTEMGSAALALAEMAPSRDCRED